LAGGVGVTCGPALVSCGRALTVHIAIGVVVASTHSAHASILSLHVLVCTCVTLPHQPETHPHTGQHTEDWAGTMRRTRKPLLLNLRVVWRTAPSGGTLAYPCATLVAVFVVQWPVCSHAQPNETRGFIDGLLWGDIAVRTDHTVGINRAVLYLTQS